VVFGVLWTYTGIDQATLWYLAALIAGAVAVYFLLRPRHHA
jgi:hypothetical protein